MSVSGMKKQLHKASQLLNERLMGAEGTKMDEDFLKMEKSVAVVQTLLMELLSETIEFLQPNPAYRAKLSMLKTVSRIRGQDTSVGYPQTEGMLGDCMLRYGQELGPASEFGGALTGVGEALQQVGKARDALDVSVKCTFIDPLQDLHNTELKDIKVDQLRHLAALVGALMEFHRHAHRILLGLQGGLQARLTAASNRPERRYRSKKIRVRSEHSGSIGFYRPPSVRSTRSSAEQFTAVPSRPGSPISYYADSKLVLDQPCCRAIYSFHPNHEGELGFSQGDIIILTSQVDDNWYEGLLGSRSGVFPISYVDVLVPLPLP